MHGVFNIDVGSLDFEFGFTLERWQNALLQVIIERIDKLRVIQLMEADLNMIFHIIFGRWLVHCTMDHGTMSSCSGTLDQVRHQWMRY